MLFERHEVGTVLRHEGGGEGNRTKLRVNRDTSPAVGVASSQFGEISRILFTGSDEEERRWSTPLKDGASNHEVHGVTLEQERLGITWAQSPASTPWLAN